MKLDDDEELGKKLGITNVEEVRTNAYQAIRVELRKLGWKEEDIPQTDEGMFLLINRGYLGEK